MHYKFQKDWFFLYTLYFDTPFILLSHDKSFIASRHKTQLNLYHAILIDLGLWRRQEWSLVSEQ